MLWSNSFGANKFGIGRFAKWNWGLVFKAVFIAGAADGGAIRVISEILLARRLVDGLIICYYLL